MASIILLFLCLILGMFFQRISAFPKNTAAVLNQYIIYVALPAMALFYLPKIKFSFDLLFPAALAWIAFAISFFLFAFLGRKYGWSKKLTGCLILTGGLGNTSFVGIPVIEALYGKDGIETVILIDLPGTFVVLSTLGIIVANMYSNKNNDVSLAKKVFTFPPLLAFFAGISLAILGIDFPVPVAETFKNLAATVSPIALISVGYQLKFQKESKHFPYLALGLAVQLFLIPAVIFGLYFGVFGRTDMSAKICIIEAAMAPMITGAILANTYGLKPQLSNMMVGFGIPISFATIGLWYLLTEFVMG